MSGDKDIDNNSESTPLRSHQPSKPTSSLPSGVYLRLHRESDGEALRDLFANDVFTFSEWAWPVLWHHVLFLKPWTPFFFLGLFLLLSCSAIIQSWTTAAALVAAYLVLVWIQALSYFLFVENLMGNQPEIMMMTAHLWNERPRSAFWVAVVDEDGKDNKGSQKGAEKKQIGQKDQKQNENGRLVAENDSADENMIDGKREKIVGAIAIYESVKNKNEVSMQ